MRASISRSLSICATRIILWRAAAFVMTDSGGIQEEATALGVPTLVLRRETERGEGVETGILKLVGVEEADIYSAARELADRRRCTQPYE